MSISPLNSTWHYTPENPLQINSVALSQDGSRCVFGSSFERGSGDFFTYLYDGQGNQIWKKPISPETSYQGVFWVDISADGGYVASGGEISDTSSSTDTLPGYLQAFAAETGNELLNLRFYSRVNQVSLSHDGEFLAVCYGKTIEVYRLSDDLTQYTSIFKQAAPDFSINSIVISTDGSTVAASGIHYADDDNSTVKNTESSTTSGKVFSFSIKDNAVYTLGTCELPTGCMRVAITEDGQFWAASLHDGSCVLVNQFEPSELVWSCKPNNPDLMLAYAVDITKNEYDDIIVACGANLNNQVNGGFLYLVKSVRMVYEDQDYPEPYFKGVIQWSTPIQYGVNPGVSLDKNATYVTATDGKPDGQTVKESAGSFYLFSAKDGQLIWQENTSMMNWPMVLAQDASSVIGGSDNGSVYYWDLSNETA